MTDTKTNQATDKNLELMRNFAQSYAKRTDTYFCADPGVTAVVLEGLAKHKDDFGSPLPLSPLRRQGSRGQNHLLELPLRAHAGA